MNAKNRIILWSPRILGIATALFLSIFALDSLHEGAIAMFMHLVPSFLLLGIVALSWRWEWIGATLFFVLAAIYCTWAATTPRSISMAIRLSWMLFIAGPLVLVAILYFVGWRRHKSLDVAA